MKTQDEILARIESIVNEVEELTQKPDDDMTLDDKSYISFNVGCLVSLAWMADCEDVLAPLLQAAKIQALTERFK